MAVYEFRLLDADGKVIATREAKCAKLEEAIGMTFSATYSFVEIWSDGKVIGRMPKA